METTAEPPPSSASNAAAPSRESQRDTGLSMLLSFSDSSLEDDFWSHAKKGPLRAVELVSLVVSVFITLAMEGLGRSTAAAASSSSASWVSVLLPRFLQLSGMLSALMLAWKAPGVYERWHDRIMVGLRLSCYPSLLLLTDSVCMRLPTSSRFLLVLSSLIVFGPIKSFVDALRFPLRFRHHVVVQLALIAFMSTWNMRVCGTCFQSPLAQESICQACQWTTLGTTGVWLDCEAAGFEMACFTFSLQLHVLLGLLAPSFAIYRKELQCRLAFLASRSEQLAAAGPAPSTPHSSEEDRKTQ